MISNLDMIDYSNHKKIKDWFLFLSIFPFSIIFIIGCLLLNKTLSFLMDIDKSEPKEMLVMSTETIFSDPQSVLGIGTVDGHAVTINLGVEDKPIVNEVLLQLSISDTVTLNVFFNVGKNTAVLANGNSINQLKNEYILKSIGVLILFISPFCFCVSLGLRSYFKLKKNKT